MKTGTLSSVEQVINSVKNYLAKNGSGFATKENPEANYMGVNDIPLFIRDLQSDGILPDVLSYHYVQYTVDDNESSYEEMGTKFVVFGENDKIKGIIPFKKVISLNEKTGFYEGLTEEGFRLLIETMMS